MCLSISVGNNNEYAQSLCTFLCWKIWFLENHIKSWLNIVSDHQWSNKKKLLFFSRKSIDLLLQWQVGRWYYVEGISTLSFIIILQRKNEAETNISMPIIKHFLKPYYRDCCLFYRFMSNMLRSAIWIVESITSFVHSNLLSMITKSFTSIVLTLISLYNKNLAETDRLFWSLFSMTDDCFEKSDLVFQQWFFDKVFISVHFST